MKPTTVEFHRGSSPPLNKPNPNHTTELQHLIALLGNHHSLEVYITGTVVKHLESTHPNYNLLVLHNVTLRPINENVILHDIDPIQEFESLDISIPKQSIKYYYAYPENTCTFNAVLKDRGHRVTCEVFQLSRYPEHVIQFKNSLQKLNQALENSEDIELIRTLCSKVQNDQHLANRYNDKEVVVPTEITRTVCDELMDILNAQFEYIRKEHHSVMYGNVRDMSIEEQIDIVTNLDTERKGLQKEYLKSLKNNQDYSHVILEGTVTSAVRGKGDTYQIRFQDVEVRSYDRNIPWSESPVIDHISHLNCFVTGDYFKKYDFMSKVGDWKTEAERVIMVGRIYLYTRNATRSMMWEPTGQYDVGVKLLNTSPVVEFYTKLNHKMNEWEEFLFQKEQLRGSKQLTLSIKNKYKMLTRFLENEHFVNTAEITAPEVQQTLLNLQERYHEGMKQREILRERDVERERENTRLREGEQRLHELTVEAILALGENNQQ